MLHAAAAGTLQTASGAAPVNQPFVLPLLEDYTGDQQIISHGSGWNWVHWNCCGQSFMEIGGTLYFVLEAGQSWGTDQGTVWGAGSGLDVFELEHANRAALGIYSTTDLVTWTAVAGNPRIVFDPPGGANNLEEGTWQHAVARDGSGNYVMIFGGQRTSGSSTTSVDIAIYYSTSTNMTTWTPSLLDQGIAVNRIISDTNNNNAGTFAGIEETAVGEISPGGLRWDPGLSRWDIVYISKIKDEPEHWALYHCWGADYTALNGTNSELFLDTHSNPMNTTFPANATDNTATCNGQFYPAIILDRGFGYIDVVGMAFDNQEGEDFTNCALFRIPVAEPGTPYSWADPGPTEVLYTARDSLMNIPAGMQMMATLGAYNTLNRVALAYQQYRYGALTGQQQRQRMMHAPLVRTTDGRPGYTPVASRFTKASSQFLSRTGLMTTQASTPRVMMVVNIKLITMPDIEYVLWRFESGSSYRFVVVVSPTGVVRVLARNDSATGVVDVVLTSPLVVNTWHNLAMSISLPSYADSWFALDGVSVKPAIPDIFTAAGTIGFTSGTVMRFGAQDATQKFIDAEVADCGLCIGAHAPWAGGAALRRFVVGGTGNTIHNPRTDGRGLFPAIPQVFFSGSGAAFATNRGKGGAWTANGGNPTAAASAPSGHPGSGAPGAPNAVDDTNPALTVNTGNHDISVLTNDFYSGTPSISIQSQSGPGTATVIGAGASSQIRVPTTGLSPGTKVVTYILTADGNVGSDTATLTVQIQAAGGGFGQDGASQYHGLIAPSGGGTTFDVTHAFGANANALTVMFGWEEADNISSVVIDPAGANITMTQLATAAQGDNKCAAYYADTLALGAGSRTIRLTFSGAITSSGIVIESQSYQGASDDPPTPFDTDGSTTGNVDGLSLSAPNTNGIMKVVAATNGTAGLTVTATGATLINQHIESAYSVSFSQKLGSLASTETPGFTLSSGTMRNCAIAFVVNPA